MIHILNIGMNHETAPVELRECLAMETDGITEALAFMRTMPSIKEGIFISTCNRVESICTTENPEEAKSAIISLISLLGDMNEERFISNIYILEGMEAVQHIFRMASSLDSMVVGEPQILGQIKAAYSQATKEKTAGVILNRLMHKAFHVAKRVRSETGISDAAVSISYAAVELAKKIFYELDGRKILLIGAGEMAELAALHLKNQGVSSITVANRTFERAIRVADAVGGTPVSFEEIDSQLVDVDIVITSTASPDYVITYEQVKGTLRKRRNRPLFFIDIAVPRNVVPKVNDIDNVYVYDIDDLKGVIELNRAKRQQEALKAERIVKEESIKFEKCLKSLAVVPTIISLREKAETIRQTEIRKSLSSLNGLNPTHVRIIETLTQSIIDKIMTDPILLLKQKADRPSRDMYLDMARKLFNLDQNHNEGGTDEYQ